MSVVYQQAGDVGGASSVYDTDGGAEREGSSLIDDDDDKVDENKLAKNGTNMTGEQA